MLGPCGSRSVFSVLRVAGSVTLRAASTALPLRCSSSPSVVRLRFFGSVRAMSSAAAPPVCDNGTTKKKYERLPLHTRPTHYKIALTPDLKTFALNGKVDIDLNVSEATSQLKLHADGLQISKASLKLADGTEHKDLVVEYAPEILKISLPSAVSPQTATLSMEYVSELRSHMKGFYRSFYKDSKGDQKILASTQFESTFARFAFPCWDEPSFKATFDVELTVDKEHTALSNMNVVKEEPSSDGAMKVVKFATTPIMSTYLLAFAIGDLEYIESKTKGGVTVRVYTIPGKKEQGQFSLDIATKAIDWYGEWFGIPYALPKCDLIAIPDFHMGAMENWGLVTFREVALLFDAAKTSQKQKSYIALVVAHELAHLWFGDLVTMVWWTDLWLKEGFASFMEYLFVGHNYEEFKIWLRFARDEISSGMELDALKSSHPIEVTIDNPNELDEIYDSITYAKSNCVNRMLCEYLGEDTFQAGLRIYLKRFQYKNAVTEDLWNALAESSGQDIRGMMSGWTKQMGYPLITVSEAKAEGDSRVLKLEQQRFIADGSADSANSLWQVPITSIKGPSATPGEKMVLDKKEGTFTIHGVSAGDYVKLNSRTGGFYRVAYSEELFSPLVKAFHTLPPLDRFGVASDTFALMVAGRYSAEQFLNLLEACASEEEYAVWGALDDGVSSLANVLEQSDEALKKRLDAFVIHLLVPLAEKLGWEPQQGEDMLRGSLRSLIHGRLSKAGHEKTIASALALFTEKANELHPDIRPVVFATVARNGTQEQYKQLRTIFETCGFAEVERNAVIAMGQTRDKALLAEHFEYSIKNGGVRSQDLAFMIAGASSHRVGQEFTWDYFKAEQQTLLSKLGGAKDSLYQRAFRFTAEGFCSEQKAQEVEQFFCTCSAFDPDSVTALDRPIRQTTETIRLNARLLNDNAKAVDVVLAQKGY